jgi:glutamate dehydrogenase/leucine dehydrogenase
MFDRIEADDYEQVVFCHHRATGLKAIVAVHSTALGPALGGTRYYPYAGEADALEDVLRLSKGMTYKAALAGLDLGGGKAVILGDPGRDKNEALLRAFARYVDALGGRYITAEDVGTTQADMDLIRRETRWVTGVSQSLGGSGDPSVATAQGLYYGLKAVAMTLWGDTNLEGRHVAVSGVGKVGYAFVRQLVEDRCRVTVADVVPAAAERAMHDFGVEVVGVEKIHAVECDVYAPCALGGGLSFPTIAELRCAAVCGCANNQLAEPGCDEALADAGILYAPDYCVNAGGIINISEELRGYSRERAENGLRHIYDATLAVFARAQADGIAMAAAADRQAEARIDAVGRLNLIRPPSR